MLGFIVSRDRARKQMATRPARGRSFLASLVIAILCTILDASCQVTAMVVAVLDAFKPKSAGAFPVANALKFLELVEGIIKPFAQLKLAAQFLLVGIVLMAEGGYLLYQRPF